MVPGFLSIFELVCRACYLFDNFSPFETPDFMGFLLIFVTCALLMQNFSPQHNDTIPIDIFLIFLHTTTRKIQVFQGIYVDI